MIICPLYLKDLSGDSKSQTTVAVTSSVLSILAVAVISILFIGLLIFCKRHSIFKQRLDSKDAGFGASNVVYANRSDLEGITVVELDLTLQNENENIYDREPENVKASSQDVIDPKAVSNEQMM